MCSVDQEMLGIQPRAPASQQCTQHTHTQLSVPSLYVFGVFSFVPDDGEQVSGGCEVLGGCQVVPSSLLC